MASKEGLTYKEKFVQMDKEARAVLVAALALFLYFWLTIFLFQDRLDLGVIAGLPLWFTLSCLGGYVLSVIVVFVLVRFFMKNFDLNEDAPEDASDHLSF